MQKSLPGVFASLACVLWLSVSPAEAQVRGTLDNASVARGETLVLKTKTGQPWAAIVQDAFFNEKFFAPAVRAAEAFGITNPLGVAVVYLAPPLPTTVYRMEAFDTLITANSWALPLPMTVRGIAITERALSDEPDEPARLRLETPYMRGPEVERLQQKLKADNRLTTVDGVSGPFTDAVVRQWQKDHNVLNEVGVGPRTRQLLGL